MAPTDDSLSYRCDACAFEMALPIARVPSGMLGLYSDSRLVGRCVLVLGEHAEHFEGLDPELAQQFMADAARVARVLRDVTRAPRINYAMLCNQVAHLHLHLMPRGGPADPDPRVSAWELSAPEKPLSTEIASSLCEQIARRLAVG